MEPLTFYESRVVEQIALWKSQPVNTYNRWVTKLTRPAASLLRRAVPEAAAKRAIHSALATADWLSKPRDILDKGGVTRLDELLGKPLELCDRLADEVARSSRNMAVVDGVVTGVGGLLLATAEVGALAVVAIRTVQRTGHCYGFPLDHPEDRAYILGVLMAAITKSPEERLEVLGKLQHVETWFLGEAIEAAATDVISGRLIRLASLEAVPGIGTVLGSVSNAVFIGQVSTGAQRIFQERWLQTNSKVTIIPPAAVPKV